MLADAEGLDAKLVGECCLFDDFADDLRVRLRLAVGARSDVAERIEAEFDVGHVLSNVLCRNLMHLNSSAWLNCQMGRIAVGPHSATINASKAVAPCPLACTISGLTSISVNVGTVRINRPIAITVCTTASTSAGGAPRIPAKSFAERSLLRASRICV